MTSDVRVPSRVTVDRYELGEGGRWVDGRFVFVDILAGRLHELRDDGTVGTLAALNVPLGAVAPIEGRPDQWLAAAGTGVALIESGSVTHWLGRPEDANPVATRMNDGVADPFGRFWAGSMPYDGTPGAGSLYRVDRDGSVHRALDGLTIANGPAFTSDGRTMFVADSARGLVLRSAVHPDSGRVEDPSLFVQLEANESPDGMTVDAADHLWIAIWGRGEVRRHAPDGRLVERLRVPCMQPTSVCLGGAAGDVLYVTTAWHGHPEWTEPDGAVLATRVDVAGAPTPTYRPSWTAAQR